MPPCLSAPAMVALLGLLSPFLVGRFVGFDQPDTIATFAADGSGDWDAKGPTSGGSAYLARVYFRWSLDDQFMLVRREDRPADARRGRLRSPRSRAAKGHRPPRLTSPSAGRTVTRMLPPCCRTGYRCRVSRSSPDVGPQPSSTHTIPAFAAVRASLFAPAPRIQLTISRVGGAATSRQVMLEGDVVRIGSHGSNEIALEDPHVSRVHCCLVHEKGRWRVSDSGSLNGTRVNGVTVREADLPVDARIELGDSVICANALASVSMVAVSPSVTFGSLQGQSDAMRRMFAIVERVAESDATVLIEGESGVGKELVAAEIVKRGRRTDAPFVVVDCGAISPHLIESVLFGHRRGAFTGADRERAGAFEAASKGTVFLDEIGEMPLEMQPKLLRVLESRTVCRLGDTQHRPVDMRIIAATNRKLTREVNHGRFREDLYFRLSVITVRVPPLRERLDDIELLVRSLVDSLGVTGVELFTPAVIAQLRECDWPGNVRELRNYVERSVLLRKADSGFGEVLAAPPSAAPDDPTRIARSIDVAVRYKSAKESLIAEFEKKYVDALLAAADGNVSRAARQSGMDRINLHRLIQRHDLRAVRSIKD